MHFQVLANIFPSADSVPSVLIINRYQTIYSNSTHQKENDTCNVSTIKGLQDNSTNSIDVSNEKGDITVSV